MLPPSSRIERPNLLATSELIYLPMFVEPVNEIRGFFGSLTIAAPISAPSPHSTVNTLLNPFFARTSTHTFPIAMVTREVVSAPFQTT